ncbi:cdk1 [Symbiodinium natans]|uniref:Cyclin-dependent kinase 2 homolog n=1 Tax=Symbiodinium natans TaxID=878477 RepID=A0A812U869_9DINO|nr:cdk1 [Symbiodinium natans]
MSDPAMHPSGSLALPEFIEMLECRDDASRVAALEFVNRGVFETTDENEAKTLFRRVISMLGDPAWEVKRAAIHLLSELASQFDRGTVQSLIRALSHPDPAIQMTVACVLRHVEGAEDLCHLLDDRSTVEAAVSHQGGLLEFAGASFRGGRDIVLAAVRQDGQSLKYANPNLCSDEEIVLAAVAQSGAAVHFVSQETIAKHAGLRALHEGRGLALYGDYLVLEVLCKGTFSEVARAEHVRTKDVVAMKKVSLDRIRADRVREAALLHNFRHPNVVRLLDVEVVCSDIRMAFDFHPTDLHKVLMLHVQSSHYLPIEQVRQFSEDILNGLSACHTRHLLHRDLKPRNIRLGIDGVLKIAGFGQARECSEQALTLEVVTLWYRSPELLLGATSYGFEVDCWSAGCIIAEMCTGRPLFPGDSEVGTLFKIFQLVGTPSATNWPQGTQLHHFRRAFPKWPETGLKPIFAVRPELYAHGGDELLSGLLCLQPDRRLSARQAHGHRFCRQ